MRHVWTKEDDEFLTREWSNTRMFANGIAEALGVTIQAVRSRANALKLPRRPKELAAIAGKISSNSPGAKEHQFKKGFVPANKGKKMPPEVYAKCAGTMFKKGQNPINHREVGSERIDRDGYIMIKVAEPNKWKLKHRLVWEQANGPIPKGYNIQFRDGNKLNLDIDNLYMISRKEQFEQQNSIYARYPEQLISLIRTRATLKRQITIHNKNQKHEQ